MSNRPSIVIDAGIILTPLKKFVPGRLVIDGTSIVDVGWAEAVASPPGARYIREPEMMAVPGFIEPHIHGCAGVDVMDGTYESLNVVSRALAQHGTTSFMATTVSSAPDVLMKALQNIGSNTRKTFDGAQLLGIHLEGPFINPMRRGTHKTANLIAPDAALVQRWIDAADNSIRLITVAPELAGISDTLRLALDSGIALAMGHSNGTLSEAHWAAEQGIRYAVHTFNAMRPFSHRDPGIIGEVLGNDEIFAEIIADGIHVDKAAIRLFGRAKGKNRVLLVSDAVSAMGMPDGQYRLGDEVVQVVDGVCRDAEGHLAGSTLNQEIALRNFMSWMEWPLEDVLPALTVNPAHALNLSHKGILEPGADADVVLLDHSLRVMKTFASGKLVFDRTWTN